MGVWARGDRAQGIPFHPVFILFLSHSPRREETPSFFILVSSLGKTFVGGVSKGGGNVGEGMWP